MIANDVVKVMRQKRGITWVSIADALGVLPHVIQNRIRMSENLGSRQLYECADCMDYYVVVIPKEDFDFNQYPNAIRLDTEKGQVIDVIDTVIEDKQTKKKYCPFCQHELRPKETKYNGCPYCLKAWGSSFKVQTDNDVIIGHNPKHFVPHPPKVTDLTTLRAEFGEKSTENVLEELEKEI